MVLIQCLLFYEASAHLLSVYPSGTFIECILLCVYTVRIKVSHHSKIKQDRHYCIYIRFIISYAD
jgi:hypothetical protein